MERAEGEADLPAAVVGWMAEGLAAVAKERCLGSMVAQRRALAPVEGLGAEKEV